jgi:hypothetical protein
MNKNTASVLLVLMALLTFAAFGGSSGKDADTLYSSMQAPADIKYQEAAMLRYSSIQAPADVRFQEEAAQPLYSSMHAPADVKFQEAATLYSSIQPPSDLQYQNP